MRHYDMGFVLLLGVWAPHYIVYVRLMKAKNMYVFEGIVGSDCRCHLLIPLMGEGVFTRFLHTIPTEPTHWLDIRNIRSLKLRLNPQHLGTTDGDSLKSISTSSLIILQAQSF